MDKALRPCPFCGWPATYKEANLTEGFWKVRCTNIVCPIDPSTIAFMDKEHAADAWNNRCGDWKHVSVDPPETDDNIYVYTESGNYGVAWYDPETGVWDSYDDSLSFDPFLYWHPLPKIPNADQEDNT